jgi:Holliday junction resolvase
MSFYITKRSGEEELFNPEKLKRSLRKSRAHEDLIAKILQEVERNEALRTTKTIYAFAYDSLKHEKPSMGARYSLKQAILELGPAGYPFEQYIAHLFRKEGYSVVTNQIVVGHCVDHEVDLICSKNNEQYMVECKFHGRQELKNDVKVSLYVKARFDDIKEAQEKKHGKKFNNVWIVTNTQFTTQAIKFATCRNIELIGWSYPEGRSLPDLVAKHGLHPVTALTSLSGSQKRTLIENQITLCHEVTKQSSTMRKIGFSQKEIDNIVKESSEVCEL